MATVRVIHGIDDLASDLAKIPPKVAKGAAQAVRRNVSEGHKLAQGFARESSGPHGRFYYKRITAEMTGVFEGEYGPHGDVVGNAVGGGWRNGPPNTDLDRSLDIIGPKFAHDVADVLDKAFW